MTLREHDLVEEAGPTRRRGLVLGGRTHERDIENGSPLAMREHPDQDAGATLAAYLHALEQAALRAIGAEIQALARALDADPDVLMAACGLTEQCAVAGVTLEHVARATAGHIDDTPTLSAVLSSRQT